MQGCPTLTPGTAGLAAGTSDAQATGMTDLLLVVVTVAFFALSWAYAKSFERL
jgi:hypothetical protein